MKSFVPAVLYAAILVFFTPVVAGQSVSSPKKVLEALAKSDFRNAVLLAKTVDNPDYSDKSGATLLMCSAETGAKDVCLTLLDRGADCNRRSVNGTTALYLAAQNGHTGVVKIGRAHV